EIRAYNFNNLKHSQTNQRLEKARHLHGLKALDTDNTGNNAADGLFHRFSRWPRCHYLEEILFLTPTDSGVRNFFLPVGPVPRSAPFLSRKEEKDDLSTGYHEQIL